MEKVIVINMLNLPENKTIFDYVDQEDRYNVKTFSTILAGQVKGYLVRQDIIDELENTGVQVVLPKAYYIEQNGTS